MVCIDSSQLIGPENTVHFSCAVIDSLFAKTDEKRQWEKIKAKTECGPLRKQ